MTIKNTGPVKHGGASALKAVSHGTEFTGMALDKQQEIQADYDDQGPGILISKNAVRLQTASELYYAAFMGAATDGDLAKMDSYLKVWIWVTNSATRSLETAHKIHKREDRNSADVIIASYREAGKDASDN